MKLKYIMLEEQIDDTVRAIPILFFEPLTHVGVFSAMTETRELCDTTLRSAGFITFGASGDLICFGESESLKTAKVPNYKSRGEDDARILRTYNVLHGLLS